MLEKRQHSHFGLRLDYEGFNGPPPRGVWTQPKIRRDCGQVGIAEKRLEWLHTKL